MTAAEHPLTVGHALHSPSARYTIIEFIGEGSFGKVAKCLAHNSNTLVAVKIIMKGCVEDVEDELSALRTISSLDADHFNLVTFFEQFVYLGYNCFVFELLDVSLLNLVRPMNVNDIRPIAKQLMIALLGLQTVRVMHTDIKPDNIMVVNTDESPFSVKLIDFGQASSISAAMQGIKCQAKGYRAPEVYLGLPYSEAIDMWGVGCTLAFLYLKDHLFPVHCDYLMMKSMVEMLGMPSNHQLCFGLNSKTFFHHELGERWRLLTPEEYNSKRKENAEEWPSYRPHRSSLDDLLCINELGENETMEDRKAFIEFLGELLNLDGEQRISPIDALQHPYITGSYMSQEPDNREHQTEAQVIGTHSPEDWDVTYLFPLVKSKSGDMEHHSPQDWDVTYLFPLEKSKSGDMEHHSPQDRDVEYPLSIVKDYGGGTLVEDEHPASDSPGRQSEDHGVHVSAAKRKKFLSEDEEEEEERPAVKKSRAMWDNNSDGSVGPDKGLVVTALTSNFTGMTRGERQQRDLDQQMPQRSCLRALSPGDRGVCARARIPTRSGKVYAVRPKWNKRGPIKNGTTRLEKQVRRLATIQRQAMKCQAVKVSVNGNGL